MANLTPITTVPKLTPRHADGHKGTYGRVLVVAGSLGMTGASVLTGSAALRSGAGLVTVACPREVQPTVAAGNPCYTTLGYHQPADVIAAASAFDVIALGPGLSQQPGAKQLVGEFLAAKLAKPMVLDADGLNNLEPGLAELRDRPAPMVLTPHPGEFAKLTGLSIEQVQADREAVAVTFARSHRVTLLLKGHRTIVTDGTRIYTNATGNPGLATGGCGDVLTGIIAALIGQKMEPFDAACLGAWVQGRAGDLVADRIGEVSLISLDLLDNLGAAFREMQS